jgi:hypothetical protein
MARGQEKATVIFIEKSMKVHNGYFSYNKTIYDHITKKVIITCPIHGDFDQRASSHLEGHGCKQCANDKMYKNRTLTKDQFIEKSKLVHGDKYNYSLFIYKNSYTPGIIVCPIHGNFTQIPGQHQCGNGCPKCIPNYSKGEQSIFMWLKEHNIDFIEQKKFLECKNKKELPFDFYLTEYNICIEFDGNMHFEAINYFGGKKRFEKIRINDKIKDNYCKNKNIRLLRIPYWEKKNIPSILQNLLFPLGSSS